MATGAGASCDFSAGGGGPAPQLGRWVTNQSVKRGWLLFLAGDVVKLALPLHVRCASAASDAVVLPVLRRHTSAASFMWKYSRFHFI